MVTLGLAPAARAAWTSPFDIGGDGAPQYLGPVGVGGDAIVFAWAACERLVYDSCSGDGRVLGRTRSISSGRFGPVLALSGPSANAGDVRLAMAPNGDAVFVWSERAIGVRARRMTGGHLGPILDVVSPPSVLFEPAIGPSGDAVVAWMVGNFVSGKHVLARTLSAAGELGEVLDIPTPGQGTGTPGVGIGAGGDIVVAWDDQGCRCRADLRPDGGRQRRRLLARRATLASGHVGEIAELWRSARAGGVDRAIHPSAHVAASGDALVQWVYSPSRSSSSYRPRARPLSAGGVLGPTITAAIGATETAPSGRAVTLWQHGRSLRARTLSVAGRVGRAVVLGRTDEYGAAADLAISPQGAAVVAWQTANTVLTRTLSSRGRLAPAVRIARGDENANPRIGSFSYLSVAAGPASVVGWQREKRWMPEAAIGPAAPGS